MNTKKQRKYQNKPHSNTMRNVKDNNDTKREKRNKIFAYILAGFMVLWTIGSVLGAIGFVKSSADESEVVPSNTITDDGWIINLDGLSGIRTYDSGDLLGSTVGTYTLEFQRQVDYLIFSHTSYTGDISTAQWSVGGHTVQRDFRMSYASYDELYRDYSTVNINTADVAFLFNADPYSVSYVYGGSDTFLVDIDFVREGNVVGVMTLRIVTDFADAPFTAYQYPMDIRPVSVVQDFDYYTEVLKFLPYDATDNFRQGYEQGYTAGKADGFGAGYNEGAQDAGDYTFMSLISSVIDAPIQAFMGLFNFEMLGVNLSGFFLSLLTVCVIVAVVKLFI